MFSYVKTPGYSLHVNYSQLINQDKSSVNSVQVPDYKLLAKQPIYDANKNCIAYELLFRSPMNLSVSDVGGEIATSQVLVNYCASVSDQVDRTQSLIFINVDADFILDNDILPVPSDRVVLELTSVSEISPALPEAIDRWRKQGFQFSLDSFDFSNTHQSLLPYLHFAKVDVLSHGANELKAQMAKRTNKEIKWIAERIENEYVLDACKEMGFDLFQGYFLAKPAEVMGNSIRPGTAVTVQIIKELDKPGISMEEISRLVSKDPKLTVQMLKIINSSLFSLPKPVEDLKSALVFLGIDMLRQWAMILAFLSNGTAHLEACRLVLLRAKTAERYTLHTTGNEDLAAAAFLAGLVSGVDVLLHIKPQVFLEQVQLSSVINDAVMQQQGDVGGAIGLVTNLEYNIAQMHSELVDFDRAVLDSCEEAGHWVSDVMKVLKS